MSAARAQFSIDDAFELSLEDAGPGPEPSGVARFGPLHFERRARFEAADEDKQSRLRYQNLENDEGGAPVSPEPDGGVHTRDAGCRASSVRSSQWSFSTISNGTQRSYNACCSWTQHPLIQKNRRVVLASFLLLLLGLGVSSAIFFVPGFLLLVPGVPVQPHPLVYVWTLAAWQHRPQSRASRYSRKCGPQPQIRTTQPFTENICHPCSDRNPLTDTKSNI
ncbi:transmembrane protein 134 isoform X2 [Pipistrellus kuhlii]|uniref:transmembrane protein 134 isoform X2 n=1 Tax=Pipistrellus kuhlii TaxID=59472 RepID=UPI001E270DE2|nr:transmembrane protein 134 isoform X2 [Pipistrellus kuhlii]